eukprot:271341-Pelagomonas_calceolata.AAC.1
MCLRGGATPGDSNERGREAVQAVRGHACMVCTAHPSACVEHEGALHACVLGGEHAWRWHCEGNRSQHRTVRGHACVHACTAPHEQP